MAFAPKKLKKKITPNTCAILPTHIYGLPCAIEEIEAIAQKNQLKVIYDAAHAFGSRYKGQSLCVYGDVSILSFQAFKTFHTIEGGALISRDENLMDQLFKIRYFGKERNGEVTTLGLNGKLSEIHAAVGLCNLPNFSKALNGRRKVAAIYDNAIANLPIHRPTINNPR